MTSFPPDRLRLPLEDPAELLDWRQRHCDCPHDRAVPLGAPLIDKLIRLGEMVGASGAWWGRTLLRLHLYGRIRVEQVDPVVRRLRFGARAADFVDGTLLMTAALHDDLTGFAARQALPVPRVVETILSVHIDGVLPEDRRPDLAAEAWRADTEAVTVWLPMSVRDRLDLLAEFLELTHSDIARNLLLIHLIGRLDYARAVRKGWWAVHRRDPGDLSVAFSRSRGAAVSAPAPIAPRTAFVQAHGKSVVAFKFHLPAPMKQHLGARARASGLRLSHHLRELIVRTLDGHLKMEAVVPPEAG